MLTAYLVRKIYGGAQPKRLGSARDADRLPFRYIIVNCFD